MRPRGRLRPPHRPPSVGDNQFPVASPLSQGGEKLLGLRSPELHSQPKWGPGYGLSGVRQSKVGPLADQPHGPGPVRAEVFDHQIQPELGALPLQARLGVQRVHEGAVELLVGEQRTTSFVCQE